jgi:pseudouridine synthase
MHPKFHIAKEYEIQLDRGLSDQDRRQLERGVRLSEGKTAPCSVQWSDKRNRQILLITLHQGWKRQIRRMFATLGYQVVGLKRVAIASLGIGDLEEANWRSLTADEIQQLREAVGSGHGN